MSRLTEKHIQQKSILFLETHYQNKYEPASIYSQQEVRTVNKYKKKRADGFLCFHSSIRQEHTISIEAKSHKTLGALLPMWNDKDFIFALVTGILLALILGYIYSDLEWYWMTLIFISALIAGILISLVITLLFEPDHFKSMGVMNQVDQYPANEKWVAISKDSLNLSSIKKTAFNRRNNYDNFLRIAKKKGVGILVISRKREEILIEPAFRKGDYLNCYCVADKIRQNINNPVIL